MSAPPLTAPDCDPASLYPQIASARTAVAGQDWSAYQALYRGLGWDGRYALALGLPTTAGTLACIGGLLGRDPADVVAAATLGTVLVAAGWEIRSEARATYVSPERFRQFHDHLRRAEQLLIDATAREPGAVHAWTERLNTARGLELGQNEARRRYDQVAKHDPHNLQAQRRLLQQFCPKWSGTLPKVHAFAQECAAAAPAGSPNAMLVADAHIEEWLDLGAAGRASYWRSTRVRDEVQAAAQQSVFHPAFAGGPGSVVALSTFAMAFSLLREPASAARCFSALGPFGTRLPWAYLGDATASFVKYRQQAFGATG